MSEFDIPPFRPQLLVDAREFLESRWIRWGEAHGKPVTCAGEGMCRFTSVFLICILGTGWKLERTFTVDNFGSPTRSNAFVYRNTNSKALFASFYSFGPNDNSDRKPVPPLPYVIEEFLRNYVTGGLDPQKSIKRIAFNNASNGFTAPTLINVATSNPRDILEYPSSSNGYINITTNTVGTNDAELIGIPTALLSNEGGAAVSGRIRSIDVVKGLIDRAEAAVD